MKNRNGFTLVELLAVIAILAILVIIALPNVINMYTKAKKEAFLTETKKLYSEAEKKYISSSITGTPSRVINSEDNTKLDMTGEKLKYCVILNGQGQVKSMKVSNGEWIASLDNNKRVEDLSIDDLEEGNLDDYKCSQYTPNVPKATNCTFDGELKQGAVYVKDQYIYTYKQERSIYFNNGRYYLTTNNMNVDGWGVAVRNVTSTEPITEKICTYINDKPVVSTSAMFATSEAKSIDLTSLNTSNIINMDYMFYYSNATELDLSKFDTSKITSMRYMFSSSSAETLNLNSFDTSNVTNMDSTFYSSKAKTLDISNLDTSNVTSMEGTFGFLSNPKIVGIEKLNTSNVTSMSHMFVGSTFDNLNLSSFDTSKVTTMRYMFSGCKTDKTNLNSFNTSNVTDMYGMFYSFKAENINFNNFNTSKVTDMSYMFQRSNIPNIDLSSFDIRNVKEMNCMFEESTAKTLNLSSFDTSNLDIAIFMFNNMPNLTTIYASDKFVTTNLGYASLFDGCTKLVGGVGTKYDSNHIDKEYAHIDGGTSNPGYFTKK